MIKKSKCGYLEYFDLSTQDQLWYDNKEKEWKNILEIQDDIKSDDTDNPRFTISKYCKSVKAAKRYIKKHQEIIKNEAWIVLILHRKNKFKSIDILIKRRKND